MSDTNYTGGFIAALGTVQASLEAVAGMRRQPGDPNLSPMFFKHSDEQTIVGFVALLRAIASGNLAGTDFSRWGVVAAPQRLGRLAVADVFARVMRRGAGAASPLVIPHRSLHSVSGTISEALGAHGPNLSVSGGPGNLAEGLLSALTLLNETRLPGLWLVLTQWDPEPPLDTPDDGKAVCQAQALALLPVTDNGTGRRLRLLAAAEMARHDDADPMPSLAELHIAFTRPERQLFRFNWGLGLEVDGSGVLAEIKA